MRGEGKETREITQRKQREKKCGPMWPAFQQGSSWALYDKLCNLLTMYTMLLEACFKATMLAKREGGGLAKLRENKADDQNPKARAIRHHAGSWVMDGELNGHGLHDVTQPYEFMSLMTEVCALIGLGGLEPEARFRTWADSSIYSVTLSKLFQRS
jgi:hypothetical protein